MPLVELLPMPPDSRTVAPPKTQGYVALDAATVLGRLAPANYLAAEGIAALDAQRHFVTWRLQNLALLEAADAVDVLRLTVLAQFLGHLEPEEIPLTQED